MAVLARDLAFDDRVVRGLQDLRARVAVALDAVLLEHGDVSRADHDRLVVVLEGETLRVPEAVLGLAEILEDEIFRRVAVVAAGGLDEVAAQGHEVRLGRANGGRAIGQRGRGREQAKGQRAELDEFEGQREYKCPDCGEPCSFMGQDFKAPKKTDLKVWKEVEQFINQGKIFYRGTRNRDSS